MVDRSARASLVHLGSGFVHGGVVGGREGGQLREVAGQTQVAVVGDLPGAGRQPVGAAGQGGHLGRHG